MGVGALVVDDRALARRVLDVMLPERRTLCGRRLPGQLEDVQGVARVTPGTGGDRGGQLRRHVCVEELGPAPHHGFEVLGRERLQLVDLAA